MVAQPTSSVLETVCPACHGPLARSGTGALRCLLCDTAFPRRSEVDVFLSEQELQSCQTHLQHEQEALDRYHSARRQSRLNILYYDYWVARLLKLVPERCQDRVLELMCGEAEIGRRLPANFQAALALDINLQMVAWASQDLARSGENRVRVVCGSAARVPLPDASVGAVLIQGGLHHARPFLAEILAEVQRVLRPGGVLVGSEPANDHPVTRKIRHWQYARSRLQGHDPDEDGFTRKELGEALGTAGLHLERYRQFGFVAYPLLGNTDLVPLLARLRWRGVGRALLALDWLLERVPVVRGLAWASIYRARKEGDA